LIDNCWITVFLNLPRGKHDVDDGNDDAVVYFKKRSFMPGWMLDGVFVSATGCTYVLLVSCWFLSGRGAK